MKTVIINEDTKIKFAKLSKNLEGSFLVVTAEGTVDFTQADEQTDGSISFDGPMALIDEGIIII